MLGLESLLPCLMGSLSGKDGESKERGGRKGKGKDVGSDKEETNIQKVQRQWKQSVEEGGKSEMEPPSL